MAYYSKITYRNRRKQEWLNRYLFLKANYETYENSIEEELNRTQRLTSTVSLAPVVTGKKQDDIWVDVFENIDKTVDQFKGRQDKALEVMKEIEYSIDMLDDEIERSILDLHYLHGMLFSDIAKKLPCSQSSIYNYHSSALEHLVVPDYVFEGIKI